VSESPDFGLYLHWPFCSAKCPYCDFNSHVRSNVVEATWANAFDREIARVASETGPRVLKSIFLGGGTPSLMSVELVDRVLQATRRAWNWANDIEITLEANPTSIEAKRFQGYRKAGVNRVSLGVQALNEDDLRKLGRLHSVDEALRGLETARATFDRVSFDLIYARQDQGLKDWERELRRALAFEPDHLSLYQLTIEPGTAFGARLDAGGLTGLPDEDLAADMFETTQDICKAAGLPAYEISNHAKLGSESVHNMLYWRQQDWAGIGPGAHGRLTIDGNRVATETLLNPEDWLNAVLKDGTGEVPKVSLDSRTVLKELLLMGLRIKAGIPVAQLEQLGWHAFDAGTQRMVEGGFLEIAGGALRATETGRPVLNSVIAELYHD